MTDLEPVRLLIAAHGFPPRQASGAEWRAHRTALAARAAGLDVRVLAADPRLSVEAEPPRRDVERDDVDGVDVLRIPVDVRPGWAGHEEFNNRAVHDIVRAELRRAPCDVLHVISGYALSGSVLEAAAAERVPAVVTLTDFWFLCPRITLRRRTGERCMVPDRPEGCVACLANEQRRFRWTHRATRGGSTWVLERAWRRPGLRTRGVDRLRASIVDRRAYLGRMLATAARVIAPSRFVEGLFRDRGVAAGRLVHMRQGLDVAGWRAVDEAPPNDRAARAAVGLRVGYIGQLTEAKGVLDLVDAFTSLGSAPGTRLSLHGDAAHSADVARARLDAKARRDPRITLPGPFDNRAIRQIHASLDVLVVPSRWYENSPNVILEAFACGTPVIAADLGGMAELVTHEVDGLLFPAGDVPALAATLRRLVAEPDLLPRLRAGIRPVKTIDEEMAELERLYSDVAFEHRAMAG